MIVEPIVVDEPSLESLRRALNDLDRVPSRAGSRMVPCRRSVAKAQR